jgi:D-alanine--poly(phosphoribitol) ligase subunit 1
MDLTVSFAQLIHRHYLIRPSHPALVVNNITLTHEEIVNKAKPLACLLQKNKVQRVGILASRSLEAYLGIISAHWMGAAYVPLNPKLPILRLKKIIEQAKLDAIILDQASLSIATNPELGCDSGLVLIAPECPSFSAHGLHIAGQDALQTDAQNVKPVTPDPTAIAYILFTSGSTGEPKGIPITFNNLGHLIDVIQNRYQLNFNERVAQYSTLSFDASVLDMCLAWSAGAPLYVVPEDHLLGPAKFIQENLLSVWFSVPSVISIMMKLAMLKPNCFPSLKFSFFSGEALTVSQAEAWQQAAPNSLIENLYGLTETTVESLAQPFNEAIKLSCHRDIVPIGKAFPGTYAAIINSEHLFLPTGEKGELVLAGPQVASGYWQDPERTRSKFIELNHPEWGMQTWYLTGDYCYQDTSNIFYFIGRLDNQHKIMGNRIELEEIEFCLREITNCNEVGVAIIEKQGEISGKIFAVIGKQVTDATLIMNHLKNKLPAYMIPEKIIHAEKLPFNANGKLDRKQLVTWLNSHLGKLNGLQ